MTDMPSKNSRKRKRRGQQQLGNPGDADSPCDLHVVLPTSDSDTSGKLSSSTNSRTSGSCDTTHQHLLTHQLLQRLADTGYRTVALTRTVYGHDVQQFLQQQQQQAGSLAAPDFTPSPALLSKLNNIRILKRLHIFVENVADLAVLSSPFQLQVLADSYHLISVSPRNDAVFQHICSNNNNNNNRMLIDIITLDYNVGSRGAGLPFALRAGAVQAATASGLAWEIPYAPALLHPKYRPAWIQTCRQLHVASLGIHQHCKNDLIILMSSGARTGSSAAQLRHEPDNDAGAMALRQPPDVVNLAQTVLRFDAPTAMQVNAAHRILERAGRRRWGANSMVARVYVEHNGTLGGGDIEAAAGASKKNTNNKQLKHQHGGPESDTKLPVTAVTKDSDKVDENNDDDNEQVVVEDGFIAF